MTVVHLAAGKLGRQHLASSSPTARLSVVPSLEFGHISIRLASVLEPSSLLLAALGLLGLLLWIPK